MRKLKSGLRSNRLDESSLVDLLQEQAKIDSVNAQLVAGLAQHIISELRISGDFAGIDHRARQKQALLADLGLEKLSPSEFNVTPVELRAWFFRTKLNIDIPEELDHYLANLGLENRCQIDRILLREFIYSEQE